MNEVIIAADSHAGPGGCRDDWRHRLLGRAVVDGAVAACGAVPVNLEISSRTANVGERVAVALRVG